MSETIVTIQTRIQTLSTALQQVLLSNIYNIQIITRGTQGPSGAGVANGGTIGQLLKKRSSNNFDTEWSDNIDLSSQSSGVLPVVNGGTGHNTFSDFGIVYKDTSVNALSSNNYFSYYTSFSAPYGSFNVGEGSLYPLGNGLINSMPLTNDYTLYYGDVWHADGRAQPLIDVFNYAAGSSCFTVGPNGSYIGLWSQDKQKLYRMSAGNAEIAVESGVRWSADGGGYFGGLEDRVQLTANGIASGQTQDIQQWLINGIVKAAIGSTGKAAFGGTNSSASFLHSNGSFSSAITAVNSNTLLNDNHYTVKVDASGGARTITLPSSLGITGRIYNIKKTDGSSNIVTVATTSSQTIDGATTRSLASQWATISVQSDGANWLRISQI